MGRKTQITKEQMLEAGLAIIIRDGYTAVSIKNIAAELKCSTTPITWSFENIDNYRKELRVYAVQYMNKKITGDASGVTADYRNTGNFYVDMAIDEPNLIRYLRSDEMNLKQVGGIGFIFNDEKNPKISKEWAKTFGVTEQQGVEFMKFVTTYIEGVVSLILSGVITPTKEEAHAMLAKAGEVYLTYLLAGNGKKKK